MVYHQNMIQKNVLRFITAGSVDDGKSTLIGRLLFDSKAILSDQLAALTSSKHKRTALDELDLALLTDGLEAEREQGITIDVAYRYFATPQRKFIIADTPGHEQYTRNMVTGASTADAAVLLIDVNRVFDQQGQVQLLPQTKRHSAIVHLLNIPYVIVAINKMDLFDYDVEIFNQVCRAYRELAKQLGLKEVIFVPISALKGDNVVHQSMKMPWYTGKPLLNILESLPLQENVHQEFRFMVQRVVRQDGSHASGFRGYMGQILTGQIVVGQSLTVLPSGYQATVAELIVPVVKGTASVEKAFAGQAVTMALQEERDISRGDVFVGNLNVVDISQKFEADICWFDPEPLHPNRKYLLKQGAFEAFSRVTQVDSILDVETLSYYLTRDQVGVNDIAHVKFLVQKPLVGTLYQQQPELGAFILIDETNHHTLAAGMIRSFCHG